MLNISPCSMARAATIDLRLTGLFLISLGLANLIPVRQRLLHIPNGRDHRFQLIGLEARLVIRARKTPIQREVLFDHRRTKGYRGNCDLDALRMVGISYSNAECVPGSSALRAN